jgi:hypothetical protein
MNGEKKKNQKRLIITIITIFLVVIVCLTKHPIGDMLDAFLIGVRRAYYIDDRSSRLIERAQKIENQEWLLNWIDVNFANDRLALRHPIDEISWNERIMLGEALANPPSDFDWCRFDMHELKKSDDIEAIRRGGEEVRLLKFPESNNYSAVYIGSELYGIIVALGDNIVECGLNLKSNHVAIINERIIFTKHPADTVGTWNLHGKRHPSH